MSASTRRRLLRGARWVFLLAVLAGVVWAWRDRGDEVAAAVRAIPLPAVAAGGVLVVLGLLLTSVAWLRLLQAYGHALDGVEGRAVFFVGQLGKYVPGGVWSIGAHAHLARAHGVPVRVTAGTSLAFLGLNLATASVLVGGVVGVGWWRPAGVPVLGGWLLLAAGLVALVPAVANRLGTWVAGAADPLRLDGPTVLLLAALMAATWLCYAGVVTVLAPTPSLRLLGVAAGAFALSYVVGVLVVVAPAGVGAREVALAALLAPLLGVGAAGAVTVLTRLLHTAGDVGLAGLTWWQARRRPVARRSTAGPRSAARPS